MQNQTELILECKNRVLTKKGLTEELTNELFNVEDKVLSQLSDAANEITRTFQGSKIDVEQLANIKKNYCSEDCTFCSQSAFFDTGIDKYQLMSAEEVVRQAMDAKKAGAHSYCLVAAWREPTDKDFDKVTVTGREGQTTVFKGQTAMAGSTSYAIDTVLDMGNSISEQIVADFDNNGMDDLIVCDADNNSISIALQKDRKSVV